MADIAMQAWCAVCRFDGKAEFLLGTVFVRRDAQLHEREQATFALMDRIFPGRPAIVTWMPGQLIFQSESENG